jgi:hypothetical protein
VRLETEKQGRWLARRVIFKLGRAGSEACRADETLRAQTGALRCALYKLLQSGSREALSGFARVLTDCIGTRSMIEPGELARFYERMEQENRFGQWRSEGVAPVTSPAAPNLENRAACGFCGELVVFIPKGKPTPLGAPQRWRVKTLLGNPHICQRMNDRATGTADNVPERTKVLSEITKAETPPRVPAFSPSP